MTIPPPVNPDVDDIADRAKYAFAAASQLLAEAQFRLAELAGTGQLDRDESMLLQSTLSDIWEQLHAGTVAAVRDESADDWDEADTTYSDGRQVKIQIRVEPEQESDFNWEFNRCLLGDGAVNEYPLGTVSYIAPVDPDDSGAD